ncbi:MAG: hypothetical protein AAF065_15500 [Verrucomicrobiota bacterium]|mgnify:FL=1
MKDLRNQYGSWALLTGASSGIGHVFAEQLAKAYIQTLVKGIRPERAEHGVGAASVPGPVESGFTEHAHMKMSRTETPETVIAQMLNALGRVATMRPGLLSKLLGDSRATTPRRDRVKIMAHVIGSVTRHQQT